MKTNLKSISFFLILIFFVACGSSTPNNFPVPDDNQPLMQLTGSMAAMSDDDKMTGTLDVYSTSGKQALLIHENLTINDSGVSCPIFNLTRSTEYRFVIIFYWQSLPIAYVDTTQTTENDSSTNITFTAAMIVYANPDTSDLSASGSANLADEIVSGILPNLDDDNDGFTNFIEFRAKTDPTNKKDQPTPPTIENLTVSSNANSLRVMADLSDDIEVSDAHLTFGRDEYLHDVLSEDISGSDAKHKIFLGTFDPHYAAVGETLTLTLTVTNSIGLTTTESTEYTVESTTNPGPSIDFETAETGEVLGGTVTLSFHAYDEEGVTSITVGQPTGLNNTSTATDRFIAQWDTTTVANGTYTFRVTATDSEGNISTKLFPFSINNSSDSTGPQISLLIYKDDNLIPENLIDYQNGASASGIVTLRASAYDQPSGVTILYLTHENNFNGALGTPRQSAVNLSVRTLDTTKFADGILLLQFVSIDGAENPNTRTTTFSLTIRNTPIISSVTNTVVLSTGNDATFTWDAENAETYTITDSQGNIVAEGDAADGEVTIDNITKSETYTLTLTHETNNNVIFEETSEIPVNVDDDRDGVNNEVDAFPTDSTETVDTDGDGVGDNTDALPTDPTETVDTDHDGVGNNSDAFPTNASETTDTDHDGVGDNTDTFPTDATETVDTDHDGVGDNADAFPTNSSETTDTDHDGVGDNSDSFPNDATETVDTDHDGVGDHVDAFPTNDTKDTDTDGDGSGDNTDCNDNNPNIYPYSFETLNGLDDDCDNTTDFFSLSLADSTFIGETERAGWSVSSAGDVNGDGYADILIGDSSENSGGTDAGAFYLIYGSKNLNSSINLASLGSSGVKFIGENAGDVAGQVVSGAGDVDGDGYDDIIIGTPYEDTGGNLAGAAYLIYGQVSQFSGDIDLSSVGASTGAPIAGVKFIGEAAQDRTGISVSSAGDVDHDGYSEILIGSQLNTSYKGATYLIYGQPTSSRLNGQKNLSTVGTTITGAKFIGVTSNDDAGYVVSGAGDMNGDTYDDILISAITENTGGQLAGAMYVIYSKGSGVANRFIGNLSLSNIGTASIPGAKFIGENTHDYAGYSATGGGDVNGDGFDDILVGNITNQVYLIYGQASEFSGNKYFSDVGSSIAGTKLINLSTYAGAGKFLADSGDVNGDGLDDILIGTYSIEDYLIYGQTTELSGEIDLTTLSSSDAPRIAKFIGRYAETIANSGDVDGNGLDDILIGDPFATTNSGTSYLILSHFGE